MQQQQQEPQQQRTGTVPSLGSINADFQFRTPRAPGEVETQSVEQLRRFSGGKASNVALFARQLGCAARLPGRVGCDDLAAQALDPLHAAGVELAGVRRARGATTAVSMIAVPPSGKKSIFLAGEANWGSTRRISTRSSKPCCTARCLRCWSPTTKSRRRRYRVQFAPRVAAASTWWSIRRFRLRSTRPIWSTCAL